MGPATINNTRTLVTFNGVPTGQTYSANAQYVYALVTAPKAIPTATPAPTPATSPASSPLPAYCSTYNYKSAPGASVKLNITDDSGLTADAALVLYVTNGEHFMDNTGSFTQGNPYPLPAACFGSRSKAQLLLPGNINGGRIYLAYGTPAPSNGTPNPMATASMSGPVQGWTAGYPWDFIEYGTVPSAVIDTTQVSELGMPLELSVLGGALPQERARQANGLASPCPTSGPNIVGVTSRNFGKIFSAMSADPLYTQLVVAQKFAGIGPIDMQIVAPQAAVGNSGFQWNVLASPAPCPTTNANGYLGCVLSAYDTTLAKGRLFVTKGYGVANVSGDHYCATSDGTTSFKFTDVGNAAESCGNATANPSPTNGAIASFTINVQNFTYGVPPAKQENGNPDICVPNLLFSQPWGETAVDNQSITQPDGTIINTGTGNLFEYPDAFAMWKAISADLNRGAMLTTAVTHPVGIKSPTMSAFFQDPQYNKYAYLIHYYFDANKAYALAYDDLGGFESGLTWSTGDSINIRINLIPGAAGATRQGTTPGQPVPCPTLTPGVGSF